MTLELIFPDFLGGRSSHLPSWVVGRVTCQGRLGDLKVCVPRAGGIGACGAECAASVRPRH